MSRFSFTTRVGALRAARIVERKLADAAASAARNVAKASPRRKASARKQAWDQQRAIVLPFLSQLKTMLASRKHAGGRP